MEQFGAPKSEFFYLGSLVGENPHYRASKEEGFLAGW